VTGRGGARVPGSSGAGGSARGPCGSGAARGPGAARDRGAVTAELAITLPAVVLVLAVVLATLVAGGLQLRAAEASRVGARAAAWGSSDTDVRAAARRVLPGAAVDVRRAPPWVEVTVRTSGAGSWVSGPLTVAASATAWVEP
jgi:hypothetical protein